jgi:hypothetical protein
MYIKVKDAIKRGSALLGVGVLLSGVGASVLPNFASADTLNPLTKRSLTLTSSSPGYAYTDGSGNSLYAPPNSGANGQKTGNLFSFNVSTDTSSGPNIKTMSFQYCTLSAGDCVGPGDDAHGTGTGTITTTGGSAAVTGSGTAFTTEEPAGTLIKTAGGRTYTVLSVTNDTSLTLTANVTTGESGVAFTYRGPDSVANSQSDLNVVTSSPAEVGGSDFSTVIDGSTGAIKAVPGVSDPLTTAGHPITTGQYAAHAVAGNFVVYYYNGSAWVQSTGWTMRTLNEENTSGSAALTGKQNYIVLSNTSGLGVPSDTTLKVDFFGTTNNYITNPGSGYFFVKLNTYRYEDIGASGSPTGTQMLDSGLVTTSANESTNAANVLDGGVTVANVMNQSIQITTKVLETMQFSVGTVDPDTLSSANGDATHESTLEAAEYASAPGPGGDSDALKHASCDNILTGMTPSGSQDVLQLGNQAAESSLETTHTYSTHSYFRLSSNSSAGATVYYSGHTLSDTEQDQITPINNGNGIAIAPSRGASQFGLALDNGANGGGAGGDSNYDVNYAQGEGTYENAVDNTVGAAVDASTGTGTGEDNNGNASYHIPWLAPLAPATAYDNGAGNIDFSLGTNTTFAFDQNSDTIPAPVASESSQVVDCITGKVRYMANIAATTPAGIYTTKINWIAAPQY